MRTRVWVWYKSMEQEQLSGCSKLLVNSQGAAIIRGEDCCELSRLGGFLVSADAASAHNAVLLRRSCWCLLQRVVRYKNFDWGYAGLLLSASNYCALAWLLLLVSCVSSSGSGSRWCQIAFIRYFDAVDVTANTDELLLLFLLIVQLLVALRHDFFKSSGCGCLRLWRLLRHRLWRSGLWAFIWVARANSEVFLDCHDVMLWGGKLRVLIRIHQHWW